MRELLPGLDEAAMNGRYTDPDAYVRMDMLGLRRYCEEKGVRYEDLTDEEIARFILPPDKKEAAQ